MKKIFLCVLLIMICMLTACKKEEVKESKSTIATVQEKPPAEINPNVDLSTIDTENLADGNTRIRFYLEELGYAMPEDTYIKIQFTNYYTGEVMEFEFDKQNSVKLIDLPMSKYNVKVLEHNSTSSVIFDEIVQFKEKKNTFKIGVLTETNYYQDTTEEQKVTKKKSNKNLLTTNIICIVLLAGSGGYLLYKKKLS